MWIKNGSTWHWVSPSRALKEIRRQAKEKQMKYKIGETVLVQQHENETECDTISAAATLHAIGGECLLYQGQRKGIWYEEERLRPAPPTPKYRVGQVLRVAAPPNKGVLVPVAAIRIEGQLVTYLNEFEASYSERDLRALTPKERGGWDN
jgi:hypothetical protein